METTTADRRRRKRGGGDKGSKGGGGGGGGKKSATLSPLEEMLLNLVGTTTSAPVCTFYLNISLV